MSMCNDNLWKSDHRDCISNAENVQNYAQKFLPGHWTFWVQCRWKDGMVTHKVDNGTVQPTQWYSNSKKLVILFSQVPVLWVAVSWDREEVKIPFTSMDISSTQNSYFKQFILWIKPVSTRLVRIGVANLPWRRKKKNTFLHPWIIELWLLWNPKKWKCWYLLRTKHRENWWCRMKQNSEYWKSRFAWPRYVKKALFQDVVTAGKFYQVRPDGEDGWWEITLSCKSALRRKRGNH